MMKIHTTQNLSSLGGIKSINNSTTIPNDDEIRLNYSERMRKHQNLKKDTYENNVSFKGKKEFLKKAAEKAAEKLSKTADKENLLHKFYKSGLCDKILDLMSHEVFIQAAISAIICCALRPFTIMALPSKDKDNNKYASAHSISSGIVGVIASFLIAVPFSKGVKYLQKNLLHNLKPEFIKEMFPHVDLKSIAKADGTKKPIGEWLDVMGNKFSPETKDVMMAAKPQPIKSISAETLAKEFGMDVDLKTMGSKPVSEWTTKTGEKLKFRPQDMFVEITEEGMGTNYFSLGLADKNFLGETFEKLDIKTIEKDGKRINPLEWKNKDGSKFMPDLLDNVYLSSWRETYEATPIYSGLKRTETLTKKKATKYCAYQKNVENYDASKIPDKLGTKITQEMLDADAANTFSYKLLTWLPDIITRPIVASTTIALIPLILKKVFHLEKKKKPEAVAEQQVNNQKDVTAKETLATRKAVA